ncbi:hypothetical protein HanXRQr2_Chr09g0405201 [Helianthus annuus]|uniref:Uncharacterized protein n=1 Tax=Helianthus annuus TaxID=4232 RepID=A0A251TZI1_HELAN|nr:hypothetical protein HanXRQr2_Chr09g0405201 [Helianthus annuus]KAJ0535993.1 hypothetical protein HanIR_Chr09g0436671 [Helianthus annuus]KAJ0894619.1 hypothetical protein HanPSC8_Chr09g0391081 [Helianthus annuus]
MQLGILHKMYIKSFFLIISDSFQKSLLVEDGFIYDGHHQKKKKTMNEMTNVC